MPMEESQARRMYLQNEEFDKVKHLAEQYRRITLTAVVDDDYPEVRHGYDGALRDLITALDNNGRLQHVKENAQASREDRQAGAAGTAQDRVADADAKGDQRDDASGSAQTTQGIRQKEYPWQDEATQAINQASGRFVAQDWTSHIPMMQQTVLFGIVRGPDGMPKYHPCKAILRWYRRCLLLSALDGEVIDNPWDPRGGSFTGPSMPMPDSAELLDNPPWWSNMQECMHSFMQTMDQMPIHFWLHMLHAVEIMGVHHSDPHIRSWWTYVYERMTHAMHLYPESPQQLNRRLGDTREGWLERSDEAITK